MDTLRMYVHFRGELYVVYCSPSDSIVNFKKTFLATLKSRNVKNLPPNVDDLEIANSQGDIIPARWHKGKLSQFYATIVGCTIDVYIQSIEDRKRKEKEEQELAKKKQMEAEQLKSQKKETTQSKSPQVGETPGQNSAKVQLRKSADVSKDPGSSTQQQIPKKENEKAPAVQESHKESSLKSESPKASTQQPPPKKETQPPKDDKIKQILERQRQREEMMRKREEERRKKEQEELLKKQQKQKELLKMLQDNEEERRKKDRETLGVISGGTQGILVKKTEDELKAEEELQKSGNSFNPVLGIDPTDPDQKVAKGETWLKTEFGWRRIHEKPAFQEYRANATMASLPSWLYEELKLEYGMRRSGGSDFALSLSILGVLIQQYYINNPSIRPKFLEHTSFAFKQLKRATAAGVSNCELLINVMTYIELECHRYTNSQGGTLTEAEKKFLGNIPTWKKELEVMIKEQLENTQSIISQDSLLPDEICYLTHPVDLLNASAVCYSWNCLANEDILYKNLLELQFPNYSKTEDKTYKELYVDAYRTQKLGLRGYDMNLLKICERCNKFFWGAAENIVDLMVHHRKVKEIVDTF